MLDYERIIVRRIDFRVCYYFLLLNAAVIIASIILYPLKIGAQKPFHLTGTILTQLLSSYAGLGYVKYSYVEHEEQFRKIIIVAVGISVIQSLILTLDALIGFHQTIYAICLGLTMLLSTPLYFYAFGLIKNADSPFFGQLAKMNLYLLIISLVGLFLYLSRLNSLFLLPIILSGFLTIVSLWYRQIRLFKHLSGKYDESTI